MPSREMDLARQRIHGLLAAADPGGRPRLLETHISWVLLAGDRAYKFKKPVNFGFLDFSTLPLREFYCREELRLNRRMAPDLYLGVVPVTGGHSRPSLGKADGETLDWAVCMRRFPQSAQLDNQLRAGLLSTEDLRAFARRLALFHRHAEPAETPDGPGLPKSVYKAAMDNFQATRNSCLLDAEALAEVTRLESWTQHEFRDIEPCLVTRRHQGKVRECHGDLHLSNLVRLPDGSVTAFDCIEFNTDLRWIDVLSDVAFLVMDLLDRDQQELSFAFLNAYLEESGDHQGLKVLPFFLVYRSMVRAKVALLRGSQTTDPTQQQAQVATSRAHIELAARLSQPPPAHLIITHGYSGSGKSWLSARLAGLLPAIWIRSDVERKRLHGVPRLAKSDSAPGGGLYSQSASEDTYARLRELAARALGARFNVIVDASFLDPAQRAPFQALARRLGVNFRILDCRAPPDVLRARIIARAKQGVDPSEAGLAVLESQLGKYTGLGTAETALAVTATTGQTLDVPALADMILAS